MRKNPRALFLLLLTLFCAASLTLAAEEESADTFTMIIPSLTLTMDPHHTYTTTEAQIDTALYEGLVSYHPATLEPLPAAARRWTVSDEGTTWTFFLREELKFHNGDPLTAEDFRQTWLRLLDPEEKAEYASLLDMITGAADYRRGVLTDPEQVGIKTKGPLQLIISLEQPAPHFLRILCHHSFSPIHESYRKDRTAYNQETLIGNGPFQIKSVSDKGLLLEKSPHYWDRENVLMDQVELRFHQSADETTRLFNSDEADWVTTTVNFPQLSRTEAFEINPLFATYYYYFKASDEPWNNPDVRRALASLIPWEAIRSEQLLPGQTLIPNIPYYPEGNGFIPLPAEEALRLLSDAGYPEGKNLPAPVIAIPESDEDRRISGLIKEAWQKALTALPEVRVEEFPFSGYYERLKQPGYTLGTISWIGDFPDPLTFLQMWTENSNLNDAGFFDEEYDRLVKEASGMLLPERYEIMARAEALLLDSGQVMPVGHNPAFNIIDLRFIGGWYPNVLDIHPFKHLKRLDELPIPGVVRAQIDQSPILWYNPRHESSCRNPLQS